MDAKPHLRCAPGCGFLAVLAGLLSGLVASAGVAQPRLTLEPMPGSVRPGEGTTIAIRYEAGAPVVSLFATVTFDQALFSSVAVRCGAVGQADPAIRCRRTAAGLELEAGSEDGLTPLPARLPLADLVLTVAPTVAEQETTVSTIAERYLAADGGVVQGPGTPPLTLAIGLPDQPTVLSRSASHRGDALIFPYFTAVEGRETFLVIENRSPFAKAIRLNLLAGDSGRPLLAEALGDQVATGLNLYLDVGETARFRIAGDGEASRLWGEACTLPVLPETGIALRTGDPVRAAGRGGMETAPAMEGFATALVMADLDGVTGNLLATGRCDELVAGFLPGGPWAQDPTVGTLEPRGLLSGVFAVRGLPGGQRAEDGAVALRGFSAGNGHRPPWVPYTLDDGRDRALAPGGLELGFGSGAAAASAALMAEEVTLPIRPRGVEWLVTMPTKRFFTDPQLVDSPFAIPPFSELFDLFGACDPVILFPSTTPLLRDFCFSVNLVPFDGRSVFGSAFAVPGAPSGGNLRGQIAFLGLGLVDETLTQVLAGLPVLARAVPFRAGGSRRLDRLPVLLAGGNLRGAETGAETGASVTVSGRLVFVGSPGADGGSGAVFVFRRHGTVLVPETTLTVPPGFEAAAFGAALAADGTQLIVGAPGDVGLRRGSAGTAKGSSILQAAVYERLSAGDWRLKQPVTQADTGRASDAEAGASVAIEGDVFAIGVPGDDTRGTGAGAVFLFSGANATLVVPEAPEQEGLFGKSLVLKSGIMGVGSPLAQVLGRSAGSVSLYDQVAANLTDLAMLAAPDPDDGDGFGAALAFDGAQLAVGAPGADSEDGEIDGRGQVQLFDFDGGAFTVRAGAGYPLQPQDGGVNAGFGSAIAIAPDGSFLVVGAPGLTGAFGEGALYEYSQEGDALLEDGKTSPDSDDVLGFGESVASDGEIIVVGAPATAEEAGAALAVIDAERLFFDDFEAVLLR